MKFNIQEIIQREKDLLTFLKEEYPNITKEQRHLDKGSEARGYWHYGYLMAIRDILRKLLNQNET